MSDIDSRNHGDDQPAAGVQPSAAPTAGTMLREARQAQGLHIAALSASIKVAQKKLEALEANRFDELPDATFTRALAQTVCRALKIDPVPVLALLPAPSGYRLEQVGEGINAPFRDRPGRHEPSDWTAIARPAIWGPLLLLIAAAAVYFLPSGWFSSLPSLPTPQAASSPASAESTPGMTSSVLMAPPVADAAAASAPGATDPAASSPISSAEPSTANNSTAANSAGTERAVANMAPAAALQVHAIADSWVEVRDARAKVLIARTVQAGESVAIDGQPPLRLKIGNARATEVTFRGQALDMAANTLNNVARLELK